MLRNSMRAVLNYIRPKALVLMYHRVASPATDAWELAVSPANFEAHLRLIKCFGNVISAEELVRRLHARQLKRRSVVITFDDGYVDNYIVAKPLLEKYKLPATFFITTGNLGNTKAFWSDELQFIFLTWPRLPPLFLLDVNGHKLEADLSAEQELSEEASRQHCRWKASTEAPPTARARLFYQLWQLLKPLPHARQQFVLGLIKAWAGVTTNEQPNYKSMSWQQLQEMSRNPLFTIGAHTVTHPVLASHPPHFQKQELVQCKNALTHAIGREVSLLAYPYGNYWTDTIEIAARAGFRAAFTTESGSIAPGAEVYRMGRFQVTDVDGHDFRRCLSTWFNKC